MDPASVARLQLVAPRVSMMAYQLETRLLQENIQICVTQGLRSSALQGAFWAQGRFPLNIVNELRAKVGLGPVTDAQNAEKVTNAPAGYSWHEYGLAIDVAPKDAAGDIDWKITHPAWSRIVAVGEDLGFTSGISWHDEPHLQLQGKFPIAAPNDVCRQLRAQGGLEAVWEAAFQ